MVLIPPRYLDCVVALGITDSSGTFQTSGTGFLYGHPTGTEPDSGEQLYRVFLVSNRHVVEHAGRLEARLNRPIGAASETFPLYTGDVPAHWTFHNNNVDVAVTRVSTRVLNDAGIDVVFILGDKNTAFRDEAKESQIGEGDGVFVLGFPLGLAGVDRNYAIVRHGIVARIQDWIQGYAKEFLIDSSIFPGNSGGPVFTRPEHTFITGTKSFTRCCLIGIVSSYVPYQESAVSTQTGKVRMMFEENSGLGIVVPVDQIRETIELSMTEGES